MSYWLEDARGKWLGDLATGTGLEEMSASGPAALRDFVDAGEADAALVKRLLGELPASARFGYIADIIRRGEPPIILTDGIVEDTEGG